MYLLTKFYIRDKIKIIVEFSDDRHKITVILTNC